MSLAILLSLTFIEHNVTGLKAKSNTYLMYYNNTKYSVDVIDQIARVYSVKGGTRRWLVFISLAGFVFAEYKLSCDLK